MGERLERLERLDKLDKEILNEVQKDVSYPRVSLIAKKLGRPATTIHQRLKKLKEEGFIKGYLGRIDLEKIGKPLIIWMMVAFESTQDYEGIGKKLAQMPGIMEVHFVSGVYSFLLKIRAKNVNEYYQLSTQKIQQIPGIIRVEGLVVYKTFSEKDTFFI